MQGLLAKDGMNIGFLCDRKDWLKEVRTKAWGVWQEVTNAIVALPPHERSKLSEQCNQSLYVVPEKKTLASCGQKVKHYSCMNEEWVLCPGGRREADEKVNLLLVLALVGMANISTKKIRNHYMESIGYWTSPRRCAIFAGSIWISTYLRLLSVIFPPDRKVILAPWPKFLTKPKRSLAEYWLQNSFKHSLNTGA